SLRATLRDFAFGERTLQVDCDVLQADGGTRTAAITGAAVAVRQACRWIAVTHGVPDPFMRLVAAISVGIVGGVPLLDLCYVEDRAADVDANVVVLHPDRFVEVQGTGEGGTFGRDELQVMLSLAERGIAELFQLQQAVLA
ncbi:MAG: ribonuclease PH, partial [Gemmatimonadales bacterium]